MTDHTVNRLNRLIERAQSSSTGRLTITPDDVRFLKAAVIRLGQFEELHEALRRSINDLGTRSVTKPVLDAMEETGWTPLTRTPFEEIMERNRKAKELNGRRVAVKLWGVDGKLRVNFADEPSFSVVGYVVAQDEAGDKEDTVNLHLEVTKMIAIEDAPKE